jgi:signal transduction histidine kinase/ligand-binding sensor domain-containing protein/DNA-binding response OmpR family regulator
MKAPRHIGLFLLCTLLSQVLAQAQLSPRLQQLRNITFDHITSEQGLPSDAAEAVFEDSRGFMWFGTQNGLCRYDGYTMLIYRRDELDSTSISDSFVINIRMLEDRNRKTIWIAGRYGLSAYNMSTGRFTRFTADSTNPYALIDSHVTALCQDRTGRVWIGTANGLNEMVVDSGGHAKFVRHVYDSRDTNSLFQRTIFALCEGDDGVVWIGTSRGLGRFDTKANQFTRVSFTDRDSPDQSANRVQAICKDRNGILWVGTRGGVIRYDPRTTLFRQIRHDPANPYSPSNNNVFSLAIDHSGILWLGVDVGLNALDTETGQCVQFSHTPTNPTGLNHNYVYEVYCDSKGSIWVATNGGGINKYERGRRQCIHLRNEAGNLSGLSNDDIYGMAEDKQGAVWIGSSEGLNVYDRRSGKFNHYFHDPYNERSLSHPLVVSLYNDIDGSIWAGTFEGLNRIDPLTGAITRYYNEPLPPRNNYANRIVAIHRDRNGTLWVGTVAGPRIVNLKEKRFDPFPYYGFTTQILGDADRNTLWAATDGDGLLKIDLKTRHFKTFSNDAHDPTSISHNTVISLCEDPGEPERILWVVTFGGGLNRFDKSLGTFTRFTQSEGLADNFAQSIASDRRGNLWLGTTKGLSRFDPKTGIFRNYDARDAIVSGEANMNSLLRASTGELFVGSTKGLIIFHPDSMRDNTHIPPIVLTDFKITNKSVLPGGPHSPLSEMITETKQLVLSYSDNMITFEFAALDYVMPEKNQYAYKLEGFDKDWIQSGNVRTATYTNLDPGKYVFRVKGSNNDGIWNEEGTSLSIIITPPLWRTTWAYLAYAVVIGTILYSVYRVRVNRLRLVHTLQLEHLEATKMHEVDEIKTRFFTNISHEFRTPLTLILGPAKQLLEQFDDQQITTKADLIHRSARKLNRLVDELLDLAKIEAGEMKLNARPVNVVSAVRDVVRTFQPLAERKKITCRCSCDENEIVAYLDKDKADKILANVLSNAFKFTPEGGGVTVTVTQFRNQNSELRSQSSVPPPFPRVETEGESVTITVSDTGIGIPKDHLDKIFDRFYQVDGSHTREQEGTGIGLALTKELVDLHKGRIEVESEEGKGSIFTLVFPLGKAHLKPEEIGEEENEEGHEKTIPRSDEVVVRTDEHGSDSDMPGKSALPSLLIVEDNADVRKYISSILENKYRIMEAKDGEEGLDKSLECIPDLIITDIMMPKLDGFQLCGKLKSDSRTSHIPVIMLTAKATSKDKISGLEIGADDYIMKPFEAPELKARIRNLIEQRKRLHEHFRTHGLVEMAEKNVTSVDQRFLQKAVDVVNQHIADTSFSVEVFAERMAVSRSLLFKKMESLLGEPPREVIKRTRLSRAAKLIEARAGNVSEIALEVGFSNPSYFTECFRKQFGCTPSQYHHNCQGPPSAQADPPQK